MSLASTPRRILIVDDEADMRIFIRTVVETSGYQALTAANGAEALALAAKNPPDLVVLDVMMPQIEDGIHTYQQFRTQTRLAQIPLIMLSAISRKTFYHSIKVLVRPDGRSLAEPDGYIEKPPDAHELRAMIGRLLRP